MSAVLKGSLLAATFGIALVTGLAACSDDSSNNNGTPPNGSDASTNDGGPQTGDAGCDFNAFVTNMITNSTNNTALPSEDLGDGCTDTQTPFPDSLFQ